MSDMKVKRAARESVPSQAMTPPTEAAAAAPEAAPTAAAAAADAAASTVPARVTPAAAPEDLFSYGQQSWAALAEAQAAAARALEAAIREMTTFTRSEMAA